MYFLRGKTFLATLLLSGCAFDPMGIEYHETQQNKALRLRNQETIQTYWNARENK